MSCPTGTSPHRHGRASPTLHPTTQLAWSCRSRLAGGESGPHVDCRLLIFHADRPFLFGVSNTSSREGLKQHREFKLLDLSDVNLNKQIVFIYVNYTVHTQSTCSQGQRQLHHFPSSSIMIAEIARTAAWEGSRPIESP